MKKYFSLFMAYRVSIPSENARKILRYLRSGQLEFVSGPFTTPEPSEQAQVTLRTANLEYHYERVIYAAGCVRDANLLDSALLASLIANGTVRCHPMGGICIHPKTYRVQGSMNSIRQIYAVGELTVGQNFFTSALEINARHAFRCADALEWRESTRWIEPTVELI